MEQQEADTTVWQFISKESASYVNCNSKQQAVQYPILVGPVGRRNPTGSSQVKMFSKVAKTGNQSSHLNNT